MYVKIVNLDIFVLIVEFTLKTIKIFYLSRLNVNIVHMKLNGLKLVCFIGLLITKFGFSQPNRPNMKLYNLGDSVLNCLDYYQAIDTILKVNNLH
jgi:hypothetical protein